MSPKVREKMGALFAKLEHPFCPTSSSSGRRASPAEMYPKKAA
jgi:hypothetical protein